MSPHHPDKDHDHDRNRDRDHDRQSPLTADQHILNQDDQRRLTLQAMTASELTVHKVWLYYFGLCGTTDKYEVDAYLHGLIHVPTHDRDLITIAVNELIDETPPPVRAPYSHDNYPPMP